MDNLLLYCARAIVTHLNGDIDRFNAYKDKAMDIYEDRERTEKYTYPVAILIPSDTRQKLRKIVNWLRG